MGSPSIGETGDGAIMIDQWLLGAVISELTLREEIFPSHSVLVCSWVMAGKYFGSIFVIYAGDGILIR